MNASLFEGVQVEGTIFREPDTYMDVELHILPLAEASEFVTKELGGKRRRMSKTQTLVDEWFPVTSRNHPSHLSMNFWKIFPLKLSQISTMYGCSGTKTQSHSEQVPRSTSAHACVKTPLQAGRDCSRRVGNKLARLPCSKREQEQLPHSR